MLVLADRGFDGGEFLAELAGTGAQFLVRLRSNRRLPVLARCDDGSYLSRIGDMTVRIITAQITVTCADGTRYTADYRLATTLLNPRPYPARALISLYHERWEHEVAYLALRHTLLQGRVLRSTTRSACEQEMWALLTLYQAIRRAMVTAVESRPGTDPDRASFTIALSRQNLLVNAANVITDLTDDVDLVGDIGRLSWPTCSHPDGPEPASARSNPRCRRYNKKDPHRPERSTSITALDITIQTPTRLKQQHSNTNA